MRCPLWVKSGQTVPGQNLTLSAFVRKRTKYCDAANGAKRKNANKELLVQGPVPEHFMTEPFDLFFQMRLWLSSFGPWSNASSISSSSRSRSAMKAGFVMLFSMTLSVVEDNPAAVQRKCRR